MFLFQNGVVAKPDDHRPSMWKTSPTGKGIECDKGLITNFEI